MGQFALDLAAFAKKAGDNANEVVRKVFIDMSSKVVIRSPVGNPELWAENAHAAYGRATHNLFVDQFNATRLKGDKKAKRLGQKSLKATYALKSGKGYVGGRFRANWIPSIGSASTATTEAVDPSGKLSVARAEQLMATFQVGPTLWLLNSLPYGPRLENGYSKQAPAGMVRITAVEFKQIVAGAASEVAK